MNVTSEFHFVRKQFIDLQAVQRENDPEPPVAGATVPVKRKEKRKPKDKSNTKQKPTPKPSAVPKSTERHTRMGSANKLHVTNLASDSGEEFQPPQRSGPSNLHLVPQTKPTPASEADMKVALRLLGQLLKSDATLSITVCPPLASGPCLEIFDLSCRLKKMKTLTRNTGPKSWDCWSSTQNPCRSCTSA